MIVRTETGSTYEFTDTHVTRRGEHELRGDSAALPYHSMSNPVVGEPMVIVLDGLSPEAAVTYRHTSRVTEVQEDGE